MRSSRLSRCGFLAAAVLFVALLSSASAVYSRIRPVGFQIPSKMFVLGQAVTPGEFALLRQAIEANWERDKARVLQSGPPLGSNFTGITASRVLLGSLGEALVVYFRRSPECGATGNCPMAVYVREPKGYRRVISAGGWGYALLASGGSVPDVAFYWNMSAGESDAQVFDYADGKFVSAGGADCNGKNTGTICAAMNGAGYSVGRRISPADYNALRPVVESNFQELPTARASSYSYDDAHGLTVLLMQEVTATAVGLGPCGFNQNCSVSIYARHYRNPEGKYWPLLGHATGWGVGQGTVSAGMSGMQLSIVIARRLSANEDELTRYTAPLMRESGPGNLSRNSQLLSEACEIVTPKSGQWPAKWDAAALLAKPVSCFTTTPTAEALTPAVDTTNISRIVQASSGTVWGLSSGPSRQLYRWQNGGWTEVPTPAVVANSTPEAERQPNMNEQIPRPAGLWKGPNGGVLTIWLKTSSTDDSELVWQRGNNAKLLASLPGVKEPGEMFPMDVTHAAAAAKGIILITGDAGDSFRNGVPISGPVPGVFRVGANGQVQRIFTFLPSQYLRTRASRSGPPNFLPLHTTRDAQGKVWIWCGWTGGLRLGQAALAGFIVTNGETAEYHRRIPGMSFEHPSTLGVWDENHLAVGTMGGGVYVINTATLVAQHVPEPQPGAFFYPGKVFSMGNDQYVLTLGPPPGVRTRTEVHAFQTDALWRFHNGQWKVVLANIGNTSETVLATSGGFWMVKSGHGLIFLSLNHPPQSVDWRQGLPLANVTQLFRLSDGNVLAYDTGLENRTAEIHPDSVLKQKPPSFRFSVVDSLRNMEPGPDHRLWGLLPNRVLGEWNGSRWIDYPLPAAINPSRIIGLDVDTLGRIWLFPGCYLGPMGFYNPVDGRWSVFQNYREALSQRSRHVTFLHPADDQVRPVYGPDSQIVFIGRCGAANYFNGIRWFVLQSQTLPTDRIFSIPPFFDAAGHLALNVSNTTWQWTPETGWQNTGGNPPARYTPLTPNFIAAPLPPPAGCQSPPPSALVKDSFGRSWWVAADALYEGVPGDCRIVLSASARQPFIDGRKLVAAKIGPQGNAFLGTINPYSIIMVPRKLYGGKPPGALASRAAGSR